MAARLGLTKYDAPAPLQEDDFWKKEQKIFKVKIKLSQHIGAPAVPIVEKGATVKAGDKIAVPAQGLSVAIHASMDGIVQDVTNEAIIIRKA